jgi:hypothetical protein
MGHRTTRTGERIKQAIRRGRIFDTGKKTSQGGGRLGAWGGDFGEVKGDKASIKTTPLTGKIKEKICSKTKEETRKLSIPFCNFWGILRTLFAKFLFGNHGISFGFSPYSFFSYFNTYLNCFVLI